MAMVPPMATCLLPVMVLTLVGVLEGLTIAPYAFWAAGAAVVIAAAWTSFQLRLKLAEIRVDGEWVRTRSIWDVARNRGVPARRVLDVRDYGSWAFITVGLSSFSIDRASWPEYEDLITSLDMARASVWN